MSKKNEVAVKQDSLPVPFADDMMAEIGRAHV